jgi:hypothetical protein
LDRLVAGELARSAERNVLDHVETCDACSTRLAEIRAEQHAFAERKLDLPRLVPRPRRSAIWFAMAPALAAALGFWMLLARSRGDFLVEQGSERTKGGSPLAFFILRDGQISPGSEGTALHPGDSIEFVFTSDRAGYLAIMSVDGAGRASIYFPAGPRAAPFPTGTARPVPVSTVLDGTLGPEQIYALHCDTAIELEPVRAALAGGTSAPQAGPGCKLHVLRLRKERP